MICKSKTCITVQLSTCLALLELIVGVFEFFGVARLRSDLDKVAARRRGSGLRDAERKQQSGKEDDEQSDTHAG